MIESFRGARNIGRLRSRLRRCWACSRPHSSWAAEYSIPTVEIGRALPYSTQHDAAHHEGSLT